MPEQSEKKYLSSHDQWDLLKPKAQQMRRVPTPAEEMLWSHLRNHQLAGYKFRRQHTIDRYIADFYRPDACLVIEVDGSVRNMTVEEDAIRTERLESLGFRVIRFTNDEVLNHIQDVISQIRKILADT